jgi:hypothetical protein
MTNGICRSLWWVRLGTYHGVLVIKRRTLDWIFELFLCLMILCSPIAVYHMSKGVLLCIYIVEVCFLWITWICGPKARTFPIILSLASDALFWRFSAMSISGREIIPCMFMLLMLTCGQFIRHVVNVNCTDFVWFILIFHLLYHCCRRFRWCWRCRDATIGSLFAASKVCRLRSLQMRCCLLLACLQCKLDIVGAPSQFLVVRLISLDINLNMNCYILFENVC